MTASILDPAQHSFGDRSQLEAGEIAQIDVVVPRGYRRPRKCVGHRSQMPPCDAASTDDADPRFGRIGSINGHLNPYGFCAPFVSTYTENSDCEQVMNSRFFFAPPKQRLAQGAGRWILPIKVPSGAKQCTPS